MTYRFLLCLFILTISLNIKPLNRKRDSPSVFNANIHQAYYKFKSPYFAKLLEAIVTGQRDIIKRKDKELFSHYYLNHIFTLSGLHLSSLIFFFFPLLLFFKRRVPYFNTVFFGLISFYLYSSTDFYSLRRISFYKSIQPLFSKAQPYTVLIITFIIDLFLGSFQKSPMSFGLSFLFLSGLFLSENRKEIFWWFFFSQCFITFAQNNMFHPLGFSIGMIFTGFFSLIFPLICLPLFYPISIFTILSELLLSIFISLLKTFSFLLEIKINPISFLACFIRNKKQACLFSLVNMSQVF